MNIFPFKGYRFNPSVAGDAGTCISPPYDVIDAQHQERLYEQNPYNIVRIIKGRPQPTDGQQDNVYTRSAGHLQEFIRCGALKQDNQESIYVYRQEFCLGPNRYQRTGFIALGQLESYGRSIKPHEQTLSGPKADRLTLMKATHCQVGQVFMLYSDPDQVIDRLLAQACEGPKQMEFLDEDQVLHQLYTLTSTKDIETVQKIMADKSVCIADGHHRYETALAYYEQTGDPEADCHMMTFVNTHNEGLIVLPTHRLVRNVQGFSQAELLDQMGACFDITRLTYETAQAKERRYQMMLEAMKLEFQQESNAFGMYFNDGDFYVATLGQKGRELMAQKSQGKSQAWQKLDVAILHTLILEGILGIGHEALAAESNVQYIKDFGSATEQAIAQVDQAKAQAMFFLNPTRAEEVDAVAGAGEKMPQKSTFFFPKMFSGLVLNCLDYSRVRS